MGFSFATVVDNAAVGGRFRRVRLRVDDPAALAIPAVADAAVGVQLPPPTPGATPAERTYSVRRQAGDLITLDVLDHTDGPGTSWSRRTRAGQRVGLDHANAWYRPGPGSRRQLLVCDLAGLPALARIIEQLADDVCATAVVEVLDDRDLSYLPTHPGVTVHPCVGTGNGCAPSTLADMAADLLADADGYCWFGGEAAQARAVRKHARRCGWGIEQTDITGYWRYDARAWEARYAPVAADMFAVYQRARAAGMSDKAAQEEYDAALERAGL